MLIVDGYVNVKHPNCTFSKLDSLSGDEKVEKVIAKYSDSLDKLRWCLKPLWLKHLLQSQGVLISKLIYLDNDLFFYSDYSFLFELLDEHNYLLTPHYYRQSPNEKQNWFEANFRVGLYNAGFFGANSKSFSGLNWWADCCLYRCEKSAIRGLFDDQKYLDLLPVVEDKVHVLKHKGCNLAGWNKDVCPRESIKGEIRIDKQFPLVFIHFNAMTIREILKGSDEVLLPQLEKYTEALKKYSPSLKQDDLLKQESVVDRLKFVIWKLFTQTGV